MIVAGGGQVGCERGTPRSYVRGSYSALAGNKHPVANDAIKRRCRRDQKTGGRDAPASPTPADDQTEDAAASRPTLGRHQTGGKTRAVLKSVDPDFVVNVEGAGDFIAPSAR